MGARAHLARVVVDDEARAPAVEVLMVAGCLQLLQQRLVGATARGSIRRPGRS